MLFEPAAVVCQLDAFNAAVLTLIEDGRATPADIAQRIAQDSGVADHNMLLRKVCEVCDALDAAGLIEADDS